MISIKLAKEISLIKWNAELNDGDYLYELKESEVNDEYLLYYLCARFSLGW